MWQEIIVGLIVCSAAGFLLRRYLVPGKSASCGSCSGCDPQKRRCGQ